VELLRGAVNERWAVQAEECRQSRLARSQVDGAAVAAQVEGQWRERREEQEAVVWGEMTDRAVQVREDEMEAVVRMKEERREQREEEEAVAWGLLVDQAEHVREAKRAAARCAAGIGFMCAWTEEEMRRRLDEADFWEEAEERVRVGGTSAVLPMGAGRPNLEVVGRVLRPRRVVEVVVVSV
jgi:hypothetical protein